MSTRGPVIAVIADTHLPTRPDTAADAFLAAGLQRAAGAKPDMIVIAGDVTAGGDPEAAARLRGLLERSGIPWIATPGNSDRRDTATWPQVRRMLHTARYCDCANLRVVLADTSLQCLPPEERGTLERLASEASGKNLVLVTHCPPAALDADSRSWLQQWIGTHGPSLLVAGHLHRDLCSDFGGAPLWLVRGLDPDKAIGGPPAVTVARCRQGLWQREDLAISAGGFDEWSAEERTCFRDNLGMSCSGDAREGLRFAAQRGIRCVELRMAALDEPREELMQRIADWRHSGGTGLSWHMPGVQWDAATGAVTAKEQWRKAVEAVTAIGGEYLTVHVPKVPVARMQPGAVAWEGISAFLAEMLKPAVDRGMVIAIENLRIGTAEIPDDSRGFGYLPEECIAWVDELQSTLGSAAVGHLLDIGHARNNAPFSIPYTLSMWYAMLGQRIVGYHLHQVVQHDGTMTNHQPFYNLHGPLISLSSFLWAWQSGQLAHAPMYLEIRNPADLPNSLQIFCEEMRENK